MRLRARGVLAVVALLFPALAWAQVGSFLERSTARLAKTGLRGEVTALDSPRLSVWLRPEVRVIGVAHGFSTRGFLLGADGKLTAADRAELDGLIQRYAPGTTPKNVLQGLLSGLRERRATEQRLRRQDKLIDGLLSQTAQIKSWDEVLVWQGRRAYLTYRPSAGVFVGYHGLTQKGFFMERGKLTPEGRDGLRAFLDRHAR